MNPPKKLCLDRQSMDTKQKISHLTSLNGYCILKIFEWLDLDTLCIVSKTCIQLQNLVFNFCLRNYRKQMLHEIRVDIANGEIVLSPNEKYVECFTKYMQNVIIGGGFQIRPLDIVRFIRNNCNAHLHAIAFERIKFNRFHGALLLDWLKGVECVTFYGCENVHQILQYCQSVKYLKVDKYSKDESNQWMTEKYPTIEHLQYDVFLHSSKLFTFLENNPGIRSLMWEFDHLRQTVTQQMIHVLWMRNLEEFRLTLGSLRELALIINELKLLCLGNRFKRLELCFSNFSHNSNHFNALKSLKYLEGLHFSQMGVCVFPQIVSLEYLKVLQMSYIQGYEHDTVIGLSKNLPNLEELYLMEFSINFKEFITPFVRNSVKLNTIAARDFKRKDRMEVTNFCLATYLNAERKQLPDASRLTIFFGKEEFDESFNLISPNLLLVRIRQVEFRSKTVDFIRPYLRYFEF